MRNVTPHSPFQASVVDVSCCNFGLETINLETQGNIKHTGRFYPQNVSFSLFFFLSSARELQPCYCLFGFRSTCLFSVRPGLYLHPAAVGTYACTVSNKHSGRCNIMCLCHNRLFMWISGSLRQKRGCSQAQCWASPVAAASFLHCMKSGQIFRPFSTRGHVIYQMNGPLFWTVEPVTVYHATRQVSPQYYFSLHKTLFSASTFAYLQGDGVSEG